MTLFAHLSRMIVAAPLNVRVPRKEKSERWHRDVLLTEESLEQGELS